VRILQLFIHLNDEQEAALFDKYKDEIMVKTFLKERADQAITHECIKIKNEKEKAERILNQPEKL
jgi:hypothetical protein